MSKTRRKLLLIENMLTPHYSHVVYWYQRHKVFGMLFVVKVQLAKGRLRC
jgi:hypothetical protein